MSIPLRTRYEAPQQPWLWVCVGLAGILLVGAGVIADGNGLLERDGNWWRIFFTLPGHLILLWAWWQLGPLWRRPVLTTGIWGFALMLLPPLHSRDAFAYAAQGWLLNNGQNPYLTPAGEAGQAGLLVGSHWFHTTSVYPPLSLKTFQAVSWLFGEHLYLAAVGMRLPNLLAMLVLVWALTKLTRRVGVGRSLALWAGFCNPVLLVQWIGGIHNDAIMVAILAVAFVAAYDRGWNGWRGMVLGGALIGLAMGFKQSGAIAGLAVVAIAWGASHDLVPTKRRTWWHLALRACSGGVAALAVFGSLSLATRLNFGWNNETAGSPLLASSNAPLSWVVSFIRFNTNASLPDMLNLITTLATMLVTAAMVWLVVVWGPKPSGGNPRPWALCVGLLAVFALLGPGLQPWYITWFLPFVALACPNLKWQRIWVLTVAITAVIPALQDVIPPYFAMAALAGPAWWLWRVMRRHDVEVFEPETAV